jgi:hypothetical protein
MALRPDAPIDGHYSRTDAEAYARRIRNPLKRAYAAAWIAHRFDGAPEPDRGSLSYMAAQGVRLTIGFPARDFK